MSEKEFALDIIDYMAMTHGKFCGTIMHVIGV